MLQMQAQMQALLIDGYTWSYKACTSTSTGSALSAKEKRCIQQGVANFIDARSHIAQRLMHAAGDKDF